MSTVSRTDEAKNESSHHTDAPDTSTPYPADELRTWAPTPSPSPFRPSLGIGPFYLSRFFSQSTLTDDRRNAGDMRVIPRLRQTVRVSDQGIPVCTKRPNAEVVSGRAPPGGPPHPCLYPPTTVLRMRRGPRTPTEHPNQPESVDVLECSPVTTSA